MTLKQLQRKIETAAAAQAKANAAILEAQAGIAELTAELDGQPKLKAPKKEKPPTEAAPADTANESMPAKD